MGKEPEAKSLHPCSFASFSKMGVASITSFGLLLYKSLKNVNKLFFLVDDDDGRTKSFEQLLSCMQTIMALIG